MINSLNQIGKQLRENENPLDSIIGIPKLTEKEREKTNYVLKIIFDVDNDDIIISKANLQEYSELLSPKNFFHIRTLPGRYRKIYITSELKKIPALRTSLFGSDANSVQGDFSGFVEDEYPEITETPFYSAIKSIFDLKPHEERLDKQFIKEELELGANENIVLVTSAIVNSSLEINEPAYLFDLAGYEEFLHQRFLSSSSNSQNGFCYVSGSINDSVSQAIFEERFSLNKIFVTTTKNYLSDFSDSNAGKNYQISDEVRLNLGKASSFITKQLNVKIAGVSSLIFPTFLENSEIELNDILPNINSLKDIAFYSKELENIIEDIEENISDDLYWLNFLTYESDGNYFKIVHQIKDIPQFYFISVLEKFARTSIEFEKFFKSNRVFNFYTIFNLIPIRANKRGEVLSNQNKALMIIKDIMEKREIDFSRLVDSFVELILVHHFKRFKQYKQYSYMNESNFDFAVYKAVFEYSILFKSLVKMNLLKGHKFLGDKMSENDNPIEKTTYEYFSKMNYSEPQKALFYLGRMLDSIAYAQSSKGHKTKPVLNKINFNGMDKDNIQRLYEDLFEKARQYNVLNKIEFNSSNFMQYFNYNSWDKNGLGKKEALFFLLAGYSFGIALSKERKQSLTENEEIENE